MVKTKSKKKSTDAMIFDLSVALSKKSFPTFNELRKASYEKIKPHRESFVKIVLSDYNIKYNDKMSKREIHELFMKNEVEIIKDEKNNRDNIYIQGKLVAYWSRNIELFFSSGGKLMCKVEYKVF